MMETRKGKNNGSSERGRNEADADNLGNDLDDVDSSRLSSIARAYIQLMQDSPDRQVELDQAARVLRVSKSRLEDVSSILEGVGYVEMVSANIGKLSDAGLRQVQLISEQKKLATRLGQVINEEATLDGWISYLQALGSDQKANNKNDVKQSPTSVTSPTMSRYSTSTSTSYFFGGSSPFKAFTQSDRLVQVSSEDTDESTPSTRSDSSCNSGLISSLRNPLSATTKNARKRVLLLSNSTVRQTATKRRPRGDDN